MRVLCLVLLAACSDLNRHTHAFVAPAACGQGPYEIALRVDGKTGGDGVEIIACTSHRLAGHVVLAAGEHELADHAFGDVADNQRCLGGAPVAVASAGGTGATTRANGGGGAASAAAPALIERPFTASETPFADELCKPLGLAAQEILMATVFTRTSARDEFLPPGSTLRVRMWSDAPNDLEGVVFMVRQLTSTKTIAETAKEEAARDPHDVTWTPMALRADDHRAPPAPLVEDRPPQPSAIARWVPGYWTWTGAAWGWSAGFWRDERDAIPAPQVEVPGAPPQVGAIWIGGTWTRQAAGYVWVRGRWRH